MEKVCVRQLCVDCKLLDALVNMGAIATSLSNWTLQEENINREEHGNNGGIDLRQRINNLFNDGRSEKKSKLGKRSVNGQILAMGVRMSAGTASVTLG